MISFLVQKRGSDDGLSSGPPFDACSQIKWLVVKITWCAILRIFKDDWKTGSPKSAITMVYLLPVRDRQFVPSLVWSQTL